MKKTVGTDHGADCHNSDSPQTSKRLQGAADARKRSVNYTSVCKQADDKTDAVPGKRLQIVSLIGIPMDLGQDHRGVDMGPSAIRYAGLASKLQALGYIIKDRGNLEVPLRYTLPNNSKEELLSAINQACEMAYLAGKDAVANGEIPIFLGGDHSLAIGTIGGITAQQQAGVIWIDAHGDFNTLETTQSGNIHGMALAALSGQGSSDLINVGRKKTKLPSKNVVVIGLRDLDSKEKNALKKSAITTYTMRDIDEQGMGTIMHKALAKLNHLPRLHVSLDMDALDPMTAPGVGTPSTGGLTYREAQLAMEIIADSKRLSSLDVVEINPVLDKYNQTAKVAVELTASLFGKSII